MAQLYYDDPFSLRVAKALTDVLKGITIANGYKHDLATSVFRGRNVYGEDDPLPVVSILEYPIAPDQNLAPLESDKSSGLWEWAIQGFVEDDKENPTDPAHRLAADVTKALAIAKRGPSAARQSQGFNNGGMLGVKTDTGNPGVLEINIGRPVCRPPDEVSGKAYFWLTISLRTAENLAAPYEKSPR